MPNFVDDLQAVVDAIGPDHPGVAFGLAMTNWESAEQRDQFLSQLTSK